MFFTGSYSVAFHWSVREALFRAGIWLRFKHLWQLEYNTTNSNTTSPGVTLKSMSLAHTRRVTKFVLLEWHSENSALCCQGISGSIRVFLVWVLSFECIPSSLLVAYTIAQAVSILLVESIDSLCLLAIVYADDANSFALS